MTVCLPSAALRRVPPRQAGNFLLLPQKKVTKEEGPNTGDLSRSLRLHTDFKGSGTRTPPELLYRLPRSHSDDSDSTRLDPACHRREDPQGSSRNENKRLGVSEESVAGVRRSFSCQSLGRQPSSRSEKAKSAGVQALCFGDFHLGPQMKTKFRRSQSYSGAGPRPGAVYRRQQPPAGVTASEACSIRPQCNCPTNSRSAGATPAPVAAGAATGSSRSSPGCRCSASRSAWRR